jgi:phosphoribosylformylglycinamidine cyclo-ligase
MSDGKGPPNPGASGAAGATYREAGVDIDAGNRLVELIKPLARSTARPGLCSDLGGFGGLFEVPKHIADPILVAGTDGVGTKLKVAFEANRHHTVGIDLVAMSVNDVVVTGAEPLFFLDYFATSRLDPEQAAQVIAGIADGCRQAGCALLGGETAELPGFYSRGEYDLAGFCVGVVSRSAILDGKAARPGDALLGLASSGLHSNGYSLARRVLLERAGLTLDSQPPPLLRPLVDELLAPTRIYVRPLLAALAAHPGAVRGCAHITGGGLIENPPRMLPEGLGLELWPGRWPVPPIFQLIARLGQVDPTEMYRTFNGGLGMLLAVDPARVAEVTGTLQQAGEQVFEVGRVVEHRQGERVLFGGGPATDAA